MGQMGKKYVPLLVLLCLLCGRLTGAGNADSLYFHRQTITIASEPDYPPYCIVDENGMADGFSIDLFKAAAGAVGLDLQIKIGLWDIIRQDLAEGRIDALPLVGRTPEREPLYDFTLPYLSLHGAVFARKGRTDIRSIGDLKAKEVVVMKGDNAEEFLIRENISDHIFTTHTFEEAFRKLAAGEHDAVVTQRITGLRLLEEMGIQSIQPLDIRLPAFRQDFCFAVQKGDTTLLTLLNEGLSVVIADGTFDEIRLKWFGPSIKEELGLRDMIRIALTFILPFLVVFSIAAVVFLRREVRRKTRRLNNEVSEHKKTLHSLRRQQLLLEESREQLHLILNSTAEGIFGVDSNDKCIFCNEASLRILGYGENTELIGKDMHRLIHHSREDKTPYPAEDCPIARAFLHGEEVHVEEEVFWRSDNTPVPVDYWSYPIREDKRVVGSVTTFFDITDRRKLVSELRGAEKELRALAATLEGKVVERTAELQGKMRELDKSQKAMLYMVEDLNALTGELRTEQEKLEYSNKELESFSYSVSHDLRAPLRAIDGFSKFLLEDYSERLDAEGQRLLKVIKENARKMDKLISDLLSLSRLSRTEIRFTRVDMRQLAASVFNEQTIADAGESFELNLGDLPVVLADPVLMKQVWENLISNAIKYSSKSRTKKIEIACVENDETFQFSIRDHGAGFEKKYKDKLFGVFQRLHKAADYPGTGIGLSIVQRIIARHGGEVWAEGAVNKGAVFNFSLPKKPGKIQPETHPI